MIQNVSGFIKYFESIRRRTIHYIQTIPPDQLDWRPEADEFSFGQIIRHLAAAERMFVGAVVEEKWRYIGHDHAPQSSLEAALDFLEANHEAAMQSLATLSDAALYEQRPTLDGPPVKTWRLLMAMVEHEVHHRSQLAVYLALIGVEPPHIYGLGVEDVIALVTG